MTRTAPLLLLLLLLSPSLCTSSPALLCSWTRLTSEQEVHRSVLRSDGAAPRLLYGVWSAERLLGCARSDDAALTRAYLAACRRRPRDFTEHLDAQVEAQVEALLQAEQRCAAPGGRSQGAEVTAGVTAGVGRVKRGFIVPGTLWCGSGNKAPSYSDLGVFSHTDSCCREHDQCKHTIQSFRSQFGVFNSNIFTMSHCDCDSKFRSCLKAANDSISDAVGFTFFNLLKMQCFQLSHRLQCAQRNWFGLCKETKMALYAEVHPPTLYEYANATEGGANFTEGGANFTEGGANAVDPLAVTAPPTSVTVAPGGQTGSGQDAEQRELQSSCDAFRDLDECGDVIPPQHTRHGLHNPEPRPLYHCNCTRRFFQTVSQQRQLTEVQTFLLGHVSPSCFLLQDCRAAGPCPAALLKADLPAPRRDGGVEERRHLQAASVKLWRPAGRKQRAWRLRRLCVRLSRHTRTNTPAGKTRV